MQTVKIMSLVWYKILPAHFGGQKGIANFNEALGKHFELRCVCSKNNEPGSAKNYQVFNWLPISKYQFINPIVWLKIVRFVAIHKITHVIIEHPYYAITGLLLKLTGKVIITHSHNIEYFRFKQTKKKSWRWIYFIEKLAYKSSNLILFKTGLDRQVAIQEFRLDEARTMVMPFGIERKDLTDKAIARERITNRHKIPAENKILLFNGTLDYEPNAEAVVNITKQLIPQLRKTGLKFTIIVTGRLEEEGYGYLRNLKARDFIFAGFVSNVSDYFLAADVYINAVDEGGGVQTKTLEALSYQLPVVMFKHMSEGIEVEKAQPFVHLINRYDWASFAQSVKSTTEQAGVSLPDTFFKAYSLNENLVPLIKFIQLTQNA